LNSKTIQDLIKNSPKSRIKEQLLNIAERLTKNSVNVSQNEIDILSQYISLFENDTEVQTALEIVFDDEEKAGEIEGELSELDTFADPQTEKDEATAVEMVFATILQLTLGYTHKTGNKVFDNTLKMISFAMIFSPFGFTQTLVKKAIGNIAIKGLLKLSDRLLSNKTILTKAERGIMNFIKGSQFIDKITASYNSADALIYGISQITGNNDLPQGIKDLLKRIYNNIN